MKSVELASYQYAVDTNEIVAKAHLLSLHVLRLTAAHGSHLPIEAFIHALTFWGWLIARAWCLRSRLAIDIDGGSFSLHLIGQYLLL